MWHAGYTNTDGGALAFVPVAYWLASSVLKSMQINETLSQALQGEGRGSGAFLCSGSESLTGTLFLIGFAIRGGRVTPSYNSGQHDNREQIRQTGKEVVIEAWIGLLDTGQECAQVPRGWG